jgi:hypothetical protein
MSFRQLRDRNGQQWLHLDFGPAGAAGALGTTGHG